MDHLPEIARSLRLPLSIDTDACLQDHAFQGRAVLPAVEAMQLLAASLKEHLPDWKTSPITNARFDKFLATSPEDRKRWVEVYHDLRIHEDGRTTSRLMTRSRSPKAAMTRVMTHAALQFGGQGEDDSPLPIDLVSALEGVTMTIPPDRLYGELVPFGPAFHNAAAPLFVSRNGAMGRVQAGGADGPSGPLGSPFPLDAAFHLASVWVQRYYRIVGFPVRFDRRIITRPTAPGESYVCAVRPAQEAPLPRLDIMITDPQGNPREYLTGLEMKDVSGGRISPPEWISRGAQDRSLDTIRDRCAALSLIELRTVNDLAEKALSDHEARRVKKMSPKRKLSYLAARLCCKRVSRQLSGDLKRPASAITTVAPDGVRPSCPVTETSKSPFCSVSHDSRFAVAVASSRPIGIDVEAVSERVHRSRDIYMTQGERALVAGSSLGQTEASIRVWTAKEAAAKALCMNLAQSWQQVSVNDIGRQRSVLKINGRPHDAFHDTIDNHLFTLVGSE